MKISIITVNLNNLEGLKTTVESVAGQDYPNIEHIIIDGASTDGSKEFINENNDMFHYSISEKDTGVYDAMNKGVKAATGDYLFFLNSGDTFYSHNTLSLFCTNKPTEDIVYGNACVVYRNGTRKIKTHSNQINLLNSLTETITHQAMFIKGSVFKEALYNTDFRIISDWIFYFEQVILHKKTSKYVDVTIANFGTDGLSSNSKLIQQERKTYLTQTFSESYYELYKLMSAYYVRYNALKNQPIVKFLMGFKNIFKS